MNSQPDCRGSCFGSVVEKWIGDGICDHGYFGHAYDPKLQVYTHVDFNCEMFDYDGGDCDADNSKALPTVPVPLVYFPFDDYSGESLTMISQGFLQ